MDSEQYQQWKDHPLTVLFHQFLRDYRLSLMESWAAGALHGEESLLAMGRCQQVLDLTELADNYISEFYRQTTKGSEHVPEDQDAGR